MGSSQVFPHNAQRVVIASTLRSKFITTCVAFLWLISHRDLLAFLLITMCSIGTMFNIYKIGSDPAWDGVTYHRLVQNYVREGSFKAVNGSIFGDDVVGKSQI